MNEFDTARMQVWLARIRANDEQARDELIRAVLARLDTLARRMLRTFPKVQADRETGDILAGALIRMLSALRRVTPASTREFFDWAACQMRRELLDAARQIGRRVKPPVGLDAVAEKADLEGDPEELEKWSRFHEAVDRMPNETHREAFRLLFYDGLSQEALAELLGVSTRMVREYWRKAAAWLATELRGELPPL